MIWSHLFIEDPEAFKATIEQNVKGREGRALSAMVVTGSWDWKTFLNELGVQVQGHTQTAQNFLNNLDAAHYFELQQRQHMPADRASMIVEMLPDSEKHAEDVILEVKKQISDANFSQLPIVLVPGPWLKDLSPHGPGFTSAQTVADKTKKELLKTAHKVLQKPWEMDRAAAFLRQLAENDFPRAPVCSQLTPIDRWKAGCEEVLLPDNVTDGDLAFSRRAAATVSAKCTAAKSKASKAGPPPEVSVPSPVSPAPLPPCAAPSEDGWRESGEEGQPQQPKKRPAAAGKGRAKAKARTDPPTPPNLMEPLHAASDTSDIPGPPTPPVAPPAPVAMPSPKAKAKPKAAAKGAAAKPQGKPKAKPKATAQSVKIPDGVTLGCGKCRYSRQVGCEKCRTANGIVFDRETGIWSKPT